MPRGAAACGRRCRVRRCRRRGPSTFLPHRERPPAQRPSGASRRLRSDLRRPHAPVPPASPRARRRGTENPLRAEGPPPSPRRPAPRPRCRDRAAPRSAGLSSPHRPPVHPARTGGPRAPCRVRRGSRPSRGPRIPAAPPPPRDPPACTATHGVSDNRRWSSSTRSRAASLPFGPARRSRRRGRSTTAPSRARHRTPPGATESPRRHPSPRCRRRERPAIQPSPAHCRTPPRAEESR